MEICIFCRNNKAERIEMCMLDNIQVFIQKLFCCVPAEEVNKY